MSEMSKEARSRMRDKAERMTRNDPHERVDASSWRPDESMDNGKQTGAHPVSPRAYASGGKVGGEAARHHAGKAPRKSDNSFRGLVDAFTNRNVKAANDSRPVEQGAYAKGGHVREHRAPGGEVPTTRFNFSPTASGQLARAAGLKKGGKAHRAHGGHVDEAEDRKLVKRMVEKKALTGKAHGGHVEGCRCDKCMGGRTERKDGGGNWIAGATKHKGALHKALHVPEGEKIPAKKLEKAEHSKNPTMRKRADLAETLKHMHHKEGGRTERKAGGRAKGKTNINIVIAPGGDHAPMQGAMPPPQQPPPRPVGVPMAMPPQGGMPPQMGASPMPMPYPVPQGAPPMPRKSGGRAKKAWGGQMGAGPPNLANYPRPPGPGMGGPPGMAPGMGAPPGMSAPTGMGASPGMASNGTAMGLYHPPTAPTPATSPQMMQTLGNYSNTPPPGTAAG